MCKSFSTLETAVPSHLLTSTYSHATIFKTVTISQSAGCPPSRQLPQYKGTFPGKFLVSQSGANTQDAESKTLLVSAGLMKIPCCCLGSPCERTAQ